MAFWNIFGGDKSSSPNPSQSTPKEEKPKPCCVCKPEKAARDDCMLLSKTDNPMEECKDVIKRYKQCMQSYGFTI